MTRLLALIMTAMLPLATPAFAISAKTCPTLTNSSPACVQAKKALDSQQKSSLIVGDIVRIDGADYAVLDTKYGPILRRGDTIFILPRVENSAYMRIDDTMVRVDATTNAVVDLIRHAHLVVS